MPFSIARTGLGFVPAASRIEQRVGLVVRQHAREIERAAKDNIVTVDAIDTTAMLNSVYTSTDRDSNYSEATAAAEAVAAVAGKEVEILDEIVPEAPLTAVIGVAVGHGLYNELGTARLGARPFLGPAVEADRPAFERDLGQAVERGAR